MTAWIKALSLGTGSYGLRVSHGGKSNSVRLLRTPGTNLTAWLPRSMRSRAGVTNVYIHEDAANAHIAFSCLQSLGIIGTTNVWVSLGKQTNNAGIRGRMALSLLPPGIFVPGPVTSSPGVSTIHVYPDDLTGRDKVIQALEAIGPPAVPYLAKALRRQNSIFRQVYLEIYPSLARYGGRMIPEPGVDAALTRHAVVNALGQMTNGAALMRNELLAALNDRDTQVRNAAILVLDPVSDRDVQVLAALSKSMKGMSQLELVRLLEGSRIRGAGAIQGLMFAMKDNDAEVRQQAAKLLGRIGPKAEAAIPVLLSALKDENRYVRGRSCQALAEIKGEARSVVSGLIQSLDDPDSWVRGNAAEALGTYGGDAKKAVPRLLERQTTATGVERYCIGKALGQIDPQNAGKTGKG